MQDGGQASASQQRFAESVQVWRQIIERPAATSQDLVANMRALYHAVYTTEFGKLDPAQVAASAGPASEMLFDLYLTLRERMLEWRAKGLLGEGAPIAVRNAMRVIRYTIDIVGEVANGYDTQSSDESTYAAFGGPPGWTMMHPALAEGTRVVFKAGDVILVRGRLNNSAAIARIGDVDSQFSHVGVVHIDRDGERWLVEALIEYGSVITPLDEALDHGLGRAVLFRHRNADLAQRAAVAAAERVEQGQRGLFGWTPYDFSMELEGDDRFFCSKLVRYGYESAAGGSLGLPSFPTRLSMTNRDFFERLGVTAVETFAPADFEVEPAFDLVAEWRDYRATSSLRMQDLLMSKLFEWMDQHDFRFKERLGISLLAILGRLTSYGPDVMKSGLGLLGFPRVPSNMTLRTISTIGMLHKTAEPMLQRLMALEAQRIATTGRPLHPREVQEELERVRQNAGGRIGYLIAPA